MRIIKNYLSNDDIENLVDVANGVLSGPDSQRLMASYQKWDNNIIQWSPPVLLWEIPFDSLIVRRLITNYEELKRATNFLIYYWTPGSYIPWHEDEDRLDSGTIYLNKEWDQDQGGFLCWKENNHTYRMMIPEYNTLALKRGGVHVLHCTTPVTKPLYEQRDGQMYQKMRCTLQFFQKERTTEDAHSSQVKFVLNSLKTNASEQFDTMDYETQRKVKR